MCRFCALVQVTCYIYSYIHIIQPYIYKQKQSRAENNRITATPHGVFGADLPFSKLTLPTCKLSEGSDDRIPVKSHRYTAKPASAADSKIVECECGFIVFAMY